MTKPSACVLSSLVLALLCSLTGGCGNAPATSATENATTAENPTTAAGTSEADDSSPAPRRFQPIELGQTGSGNGSAARKLTAEESESSIREALDPLQIMVGQWKGITFRGKNYEELEWVWDFKSQPAQPALVMKSEKGEYIREGRLTYLPEEKKYRFTLTPPEGEPRVLEGEFTEEPATQTGDDGKPQRVYKLALAQVEPAEGEQWQLVFNQQENNRYNLELSRKRGSSPFNRFDTVGSQRMGTSFALNDEDYGEKKCIISGGLGTTAVTYKGKTYWVCCSGCKAAFEEEPERWLAKLAASESK